MWGPIWVAMRYGSKALFGHRLLREKAIEMRRSAGPVCNGAETYLPIVVYFKMYY